MEVGWTSGPVCCPSEATATLVPRLCVPKATPPCAMQDPPKAILAQGPSPKDTQLAPHPSSFSPTVLPPVSRSQDQVALPGCPRRAGHTSGELTGHRKENKGSRPPSALGLQGNDHLLCSQQMHAKSDASPARLGAGICKKPAPLGTEQAQACRGVPRRQADLLCRTLAHKEGDARALAESTSAPRDRLSQMHQRRFVMKITD